MRERQARHPGSRLWGIECNKCAHSRPVHARVKVAYPIWNVVALGGAEAGAQPLPLQASALARRRVIIRALFRSEYTEDITLTDAIERRVLL